MVGESEVEQRFGRLSLETETRLERRRWLHSSLGLFLFFLSSSVLLVFSSHSFCNGKSVFLAFFRGGSGLKNEDGQSATVETSDVTHVYLEDLIRFKS